MAIEGRGEDAMKQVRMARRGAFEVKLLEYV
jgi:hypothetical protein